MLTTAARLRQSMPTHNSIKGASMSYHKQVRWSVGAAVVSVTSFLSGCVTPPEQKPLTCVDPTLAIQIDVSGNPTGVVDAATGKNADVVTVCPDADVKWTAGQGFDIEFKGKTPFGWNKRVSNPASGKHEVPGKIKSAGGIHCDAYKYAVVVNGRTLDPIIIVDK